MARLETIATEGEAAHLREYEDGEFELSDMNTVELSAVGSPATGRTWKIFKMASNAMMRKAESQLCVMKRVADLRIGDGAFVEIDGSRDAEPSYAVVVAKRNDGGASLRIPTAHGFGKAEAGPDEIVYAYPRWLYGRKVAKVDFSKPLFPLGQVVATPGALEALERNGQEGRELLQRHQRGDWGDVDPEDKKANDEAVKSGERIHSAYVLKDKTRIWLITEWDRSVSTLLLPDEY